VGGNGVLLTKVGREGGERDVRGNFRSEGSRERENRKGGGKTRGRPRDMKRDDSKRRGYRQISKNLEASDPEKGKKRTPSHAD